MANIIESLYPAWRVLAISINHYNDVKNDDQLQSTRAVHASVLNPANAMEMFDSITYAKGAALLRMLECFIGEKTFQQGVHAYLTRHAYGNATTQDLWASIATVSTHLIPINEMMNSWIYQAGLPAC